MAIVKRMPIKRMMLVCTMLGMTALGQGSLTHAWASGPIASHTVGASSGEGSQSGEGASPQTKPSTDQPTAGDNTTDKEGSHDENEDENPNSIPPKEAFIFLLLGAFIGLPLYFLPTGIAFYRRHESAVIILLLNVVVSLTGIGWIITLIWACAGKSLKDKKPSGGQGEAVQPPPFPQHPQPSPEGLSASALEQLESIGRLHAQGELSDAEFEALKARILKDM